MRNDGDIIIISTQSRKGGVGKTTVALNLAKLTLGDESEVVFLDLDIAGTASDTFDKILIAPKVHIVTDSETKPKNESMNLVALFERYMAGNALPSISCKKVKKGPYIQLVPGEINVFSSFLERDGSGKHEHSYGPAALFDEMHSVWFIEMLKELVKKCADAFKSETKKNLIVIIDNAPGYSGLEPAIEEWLTDLGPECGKIIFVGSLDPQDFLACIKGLIGVHNLYCDKWKAFQEYLDLCENKNYVERDLNERSQAFIQRLFENRGVENTLCPQTALSKKNNPYCSYCGLCFYLQERIDTETEQDNKYKKSAQNYLAFVLSKTPTATLARYNYRTDIILSKLGWNPSSNEVPTLDNFSKHICDCRDEIPAGIISMLKDSFEHPMNIMIPYKSAYALMFMGSQLVQKAKLRAKLRAKLSEDTLDETLMKLLERITAFDSYAKANAVDNLPHTTKSSYLGISACEGIELICAREKMLDELDDRELSTANTNSDKYERLLPYYNKFAKLLFEYLRMDVIDDAPNKKITFTDDKEFYDKASELIKALEIPRYIDVPYSVTLGVFENRKNFIPFSIARDILIAIAFSESKEWKLDVQGRQQDIDFKRIQGLSFFMMGIVSIVIRDYYKAYTTYKPVVELEQWIWLELADKVNITKKIANVVAGGYPLNSPCIENNDIPLALSVFRAFCVAQARFMDFIKQPEETLNILAHQQLSIDKGEIDNREGRKEETTDIEKATKEIMKMQDYNSCLGPILRKWGIFEDKQ